MIDTETKEVIEDTLKNIKFSGINWLKNDGFFYSSYDTPEGSELSQKTDQHKLYFHRLETPQAEDELIYGGKDAEKIAMWCAQVTDNGHYLLISASVSTSGNKLFLKDLRNKEAPLRTMAGSMTVIITCWRIREISYT